MYLFIYIYIWICIYLNGEALELDDSILLKKNYLDVANFANFNRV
jgi:hypothetical protein